MGRLTDALDGRQPIPVIGAFESIFQPAFDVDNTESTDHHRRWQDDLELLRASEVRDCRYPIRWHRLESEPGAYDWRETDQRLGWFRDNGVDPIVDLLHHTSYPRWLEGFTDPRFADAYLAFLAAFAARYPWIRRYTLCNEPLTTILLCGQEGVWPPHRTGLAGFIDLARAILPPLAEASRMYRELLPDAEHWYVDVAEHHVASAPNATWYTAYANDRRFAALDMVLGHDLDTSRPFLQAVVEAGAEDLLTIEPGSIDVLGLDYYAHCQWEFTGPAGEGHMHASHPRPMASLLVEYSDRYQVPLWVGETNIRGYSSDRASWLKYTLEQCEVAQEAGVDVRGYCWFPFVDSCDWDSVLTRAQGHIDPVGVYWLDEALNRRPSCMSDAFTAAASGIASQHLPAFRFRPPVSDWLQGWLPHMSHWEWQEPPVYPTDPPPPEGPIELRIEDAME